MRSQTFGIYSTLLVARGGSMIRPSSDVEEAMGRAKSVVCSLVAGVALVGGVSPLPAMAADVDEPSATDGVNALSTFPEFASMSDSAESDLPLVLKGTIEQITGAAMPGAQVLLWAWPSNESVRRMPIGGELELTPVARTVADDSGKYALRSPVTALVPSLAGPDGIDIQLEVFHGDRHYTHLSQVTPTADGEWIRELTGLVEPVGTAVEAAGNLLDLTLDRTKAAVEGGLGVVGTGPVATEFRKPVPPGCTPFEKVGDVIVPETVATAVARNGAGVDVMYTAEAKTESSTGGSFLGGAFAINGSRSRTFGLEANFVDLMSTRRKSVNQEYQVLMLHNIWRRSCARDFRGNEDVLYITNPAGAPEGDGQGTGFPEKSHYPSWKVTIQVVGMGFQGSPSMASRSA